MQERIFYEFSLDGVPFKIEVGEVGLLTQSSLLATYGETTVYVTVSVGKYNPSVGFLPLTVDYSEKLYASGIISSSPYSKREGKPTESEILNGRLIDHAIRSLFDLKFKNEVQVIVQVFSYDYEHDPLLAGIIGVSFALCYSGLPFFGPYGTTKVGYINSEIICNPTLSQLKNSALNMMVSSVDKGVVSVEAEAHDLPDEIIKQAILRADSHNKYLIDEQLRFIEKYGKKEFTYEINLKKEEVLIKLIDEVETNHRKDLESCLYLNEKKSRSNAIEELQAYLTEKHTQEIESGDLTEADIALAIEKVSKKIVRKNILENSKRLDGRGLDEVRPISAKVGVLPRVHGSALFTRGETQSLTIVTIGTDRDCLFQQGLEGDKEKRYFHHYNMPGYANGEIDKKFGLPNRRSIGHGMIGEKALLPMLPLNEDFPYTIRVVSEILTSNGSTSMAATCGSTLALMDAGVKIKKMVGGIGVGLVYEDDNNYRILSDIIGMEDFYGDIDFKIAGTKDGITAIQLDNKMSGIPLYVLLEAIDKSKAGRIHVINEMEKCIKEPRASISKHAPKVKIIQIDADKIGELIGPGGKVIKHIIEKTGVEIDIGEDGRVKIYSKGDQDKFDMALSMINGVVREAKIGDVYDAEVVRVENYGVFVEVPYTKIHGLVHVSNLGLGHVKDVTRLMKIGDKMKIKFLGRDDKGRTKLMAIVDNKQDK